MTKNVKKKVSARTTVRLPEDVHHSAKVAAALLNTTIQEFVAQAVTQRLARLEYTLAFKQREPAER